MKNLGSFRRNKSHEINITVRGHSKSMYVLKGEGVPKKHTKTYREGGSSKDARTLIEFSNSNYL